jgi:hypothetical protein
MKHIKLFENFKSQNIFIPENKYIKINSNKLIDFFKGLAIKVVYEDLSLKDIGAISEKIYELEFPIEPFNYDGSINTNIFSDIVYKLERYHFIEKVYIDTNKYFIRIEFKEGLNVELY